MHTRVFSQFLPRLREIGMDIKPESQNTSVPIPGRKCYTLFDQGRTVAQFIFYVDSQGFLVSTQQNAVAPSIVRKYNMLKDTFPGTDGGQCDFLVSSIYSADPESNLIALLEWFISCGPQSEAV